MITYYYWRITMSFKSLLVHRNSNVCDDGTYYRKLFYKILPPTVNKRDMLHAGYPLLGIILACVFININIWSPNLLVVFLLALFISMFSLVIIIMIKMNNLLRLREILTRYKLRVNCDYDTNCNISDNDKLTNLDHHVNSVLRDLYYDQINKIPSQKHFRLAEFSYIVSPIILLVSIVLTSYAIGIKCSDTIYSINTVVGIEEPLKDQSSFMTLPTVSLSYGVQLLDISRVISDTPECKRSSKIIVDLKSHKFICEQPSPSREKYTKTIMEAVSKNGTINKIVVVD